MKSRGIVSVQSESLTNQIQLAALINKNLKKVFRYVRTQRLCVPSYQAGEFSLTMASDFDFNKIKIGTLRRKSKNFKLKYWSPEMHFASAVLPKYISEKMN